MFYIAYYMTFGILTFSRPEVIFVTKPGGILGADQPFREFDMKKFFLAAVTLTAFAAASFATDYARIDLNFYCRGSLKCISPKKTGVQIVPKRDYPNGNHPDKCYYSITVNLDRAQEVELVYEVADTENRDGVKLTASITPIRLPKGSGAAEVECVEFEFGGKSSTLVPRKITKWTNMTGAGIKVSVGDRVTVRAKFRKSAE